MRGRRLGFPTVDPIMAYIAEAHWWSQKRREGTDLEFHVANEAKPRKVIFDALEKFLGRRLLVQLARSKSAPQHCKTRDGIDSNLLGFYL